MALTSKAQEPKAQITSVGRLFPVLNFVNKLAGGLQFEHSNFRLMVAYRIGMVLVNRILRLIYFTPARQYQEAIAQDSSRNNLSNFSLLYILSAVALSVCCIITGSLNHKTMSLVLRKRLDANYLRPISSWAGGSSKPAAKPEALSRQQQQQQQQPAGGRECDPSGTIEAESDFTPIRMNDVTLVRCSIILAIGISAAVTWTCEEFGNYILVRSQTNTSVEPASANSSLAIDGEATRSHAARRHLVYLRLSQVAGPLDLALQVALDTPIVWLAHLTLAVLDYFQNYGQISLGLMSTACMTEILKRIGEQERHKVALRAEHRQATTIRVRSKPPASPPRAPPAIVLQTTELLVHIRDVLLTLRSALLLDYLFANIFDICRLITIFGSIVTLLGTQRHDWALLTAFELLRINVTTIFCRLGYHRLHARAARVKGLIYERLVHSSMESNGSVRSFEAGSRIETITNYRLAKEIEELWPTDWFVPDIKSCLTQNLLVITFVATLQQLVGMSSQPK